MEKRKKLGFIDTIKLAVKIYRSVKEWTKENKPLGVKLGYPKCCIDAFCADTPLILKLRPITFNDQVRLKAAYIGGEYTGFIPCVKCADKIISGEINIQDLIKNRSSEFKEFPNHW